MRIVGIQVRVETISLYEVDQADSVYDKEYRGIGGGSGQTSAVARRTGRLLVSVDRVELCSIYPTLLVKYD